jgi:serine/threonine protein kinase
MSTRSEAEALILGLLGSEEGLDEARLEALCAERPALAAELRRLWTSWQEVEPMLRSMLGEGALDVSLSRLLGEAGDGSDALLEEAARPDLSLPMVGLSPRGERGATTPAEVLARLRAQPDAGGRFTEAGLIGRGGMGAIHRVYDADLHRHLAMKVLHTRADGAQEDAASEAALARFLEEALVTGQLDHPGIVPVHDLGVDETGRVYFTMKLVKGRDFQAILGMLRRGEEGWSLNRAVGVLRRVCEAVAYAHSKGVIHRDIKPANIMVGRYGETYLMDWGLARVLGADPGHDASGAASEAEGQDSAAEPGGVEVPEGLPAAATAGDDASRPDSWLFTQDGRVLGTPVYMSPEQARGDVLRVDHRSDIYSLGAILYHLLTGRMPYVTPGESPPPFLVLMQARREAPVPVTELAPDAPPTLVAICERAMAREIDQRHASAEELAAELEDYLEDVSEAREEARAQARRAQRINAFLLEMLASGDPGQAQGRQVTVREVLDRAAQRVEGAFPEQPLDEAALSETIGNLYRELGLLGAAERHLLRAAALRRDVRGEEHPETLAAVTDLALLYRRLGRLDESEALLRTTLERQEAALGAEHPDALRTLDILAGVARLADRPFTDVEALYRRALDGRRQALGEDDSDTLATQNSLALLLKDAGRADEAVPMQRCVVESLLFGLGPRHPSVLIARNDLAAMLQAAGDMQEAEALLRDVLDNQHVVLGDVHPETVTTMNNLAMLLKQRGDLAQAEDLLAHALEAQRTIAGSDNHVTLSFANNLGLVRIDRGRPEEAEVLLRDCLVRAEASLGEEHRLTARFRYNLGRCMLARQHFDTARELLRSAHAVLERLLPPGHDWIAEAAQALAAAEAGRSTAPSPPPRSSATRRPARPDR